MLSAKGRLFSLGPNELTGAAYMCQETGSSLAQVMVYHLFDAKPLPEPVLVYCQLESWQQVTVKFD